MHRKQLRRKSEKLGLSCRNLTTPNLEDSQAALTALSTLPVTGRSRVLSHRPVTGPPERARHCASSAPGAPAGESPAGVIWKWTRWGARDCGTWPPPARIAAGPRGWAPFPEAPAPFRQARPYRERGGPDRAPRAGADPRLGPVDWAYSPEVLVPFRQLCPYRERGGPDRAHLRPGARPPLSALLRSPATIPPPSLPAPPACPQLGEAAAGALRPAAGRPGCAAGVRTSLVIVRGSPPVGAGPAGLVGTRRPGGSGRGPWPWRRSRTSPLGSRTWPWTGDGRPDMPALNGPVLPPADPAAPPPRRLACRGGGGGARVLARPGSAARRPAAGLQLAPVRWCLQPTQPASRDLSLACHATTLQATSVQ